MKPQDKIKYDNLLEELSQSSTGLSHLCKKHEIRYQSLYQLIEEDEDFRNRYVRAREAQADYMADEIIELADDKSGDVLTGEFGETGNAANVSRSKLRVEARKWIAAKLKPKKYGDKVDVEHSGKIEIDFKDAE